MKLRKGLIDKIYFTNLVTQTKIRFMALKNIRLYDLLKYLYVNKYLDVNKKILNTSRLVKQTDLQQ